MTIHCRSASARIIPILNGRWSFCGSSLPLLVTALLLVTACQQEPATPVSEAPATQLPRGVSPVGEPLTTTGSTGSQDLEQWLAAFSQTTRDMQVPSYIIGPADQPLIAAVVLHYDDFTPVILRQPSSEALQKARSNSNAEGVSAWEALHQDQVAVIGSSFLSLVRTLEPLGLLKVDGELISDLEIHGYTRVLGINDQQQLAVVHRSEYPAQQFSSALQAGPGIIEVGVLDISIRDLQRPRYFRSFVATCTDRVLIGVTLQPMNLRTVGEALLEAAYKHHLSCAEVINLAGDREAVLALRSTENLVFHGNPAAKKAALIGFRRRSQSTQ